MEDTMLEQARQVLRLEAEAVLEQVERIDEHFKAAVEMIMACPGRTVITGMGKSGIIGRKMAATLASTGTPSFYLHPAEGIHGDLGMVTEGDVVIALSNSGETGEVLHGPEMISRGFVFEQQYSHLLEDAKCLVLDQLESTNPNDISRLSDRIRSSLRRFFRDVLGRDPIVVPIVSQV